MAAQGEAVGPPGALRCGARPAYRGRQALSLLRDARGARTSSASACSRRAVRGSTIAPRSGFPMPTAGGWKAKDAVRTGASGWPRRRCAGTTWCAGPRTSTKRAHLPLLVDAHGGGPSKRTGSFSVDELRERGIEALAVSALLARLGTADPVEPVTSLDALVATVDFARVGRRQRGSPRTSWCISAPVRFICCPTKPCVSVSGIGRRAGANPFSGPEMAKPLPLIGCARAVARLSGTSA